MSLDVSKLSHTTNGAEGASNVVEAIRSIAQEDPSSDARATVSKADLSAPFIRTPAEESSLVSSLRDDALAAGNGLVAHADQFWLLACVRARKGDIQRALALADNYLKWRVSIGSDEFNVAKSEKMRMQLERCILFVAGNTDREGRPVLNLRLRNQDPSTFAAVDTTRMISFVLEWTLRTYPAAQTHGVVIVNDFADVSFRNLDIRLPGVLRKAFSSTVPVRLASINVVNPPGFFKVIFAIVAPILSMKFKARIRQFSSNNQERFSELFSADQIMKDTGMGGTAEWTEEMHQDWIERMVKDCQTWGPVTTYKEDG